MSSSDYVPLQDNFSDSEMPDLITDEDFPDLKSDESSKTPPPTLSSGVTESPSSEEILDSFACKTSETTVTVALARVSLSSGDKDSEDSSSQKEQTKADSPIFVGACVAHVPYPFVWYKQKYPESSIGSPFLEPLITGRSFSLSQLDQIDDVVLENYRSIDQNCTPIPAGFWVEYERIDTLMDFMLKNFESSLPNEEWVFRRLAEGSRPSAVLKRFFIFLFNSIFSFNFSLFFFKLFQNFYLIFFLGYMTPFPRNKTGGWRFLIERNVFCPISSVCL